MTKRQIRLAMFNYIDTNLKGYTERLFKLRQQKRITLGHAMLMNIYENYNYEEMVNCNIDNTNKWYIEHWYKDFIKEMEENLKEIEKQENLPFEETQMQQCIKNGTIQYIG